MNCSSEARVKLRSLLLTALSRVVVDGLEPCAVDRQQLAPEQVEPPAQQHELAEDRPERGAVVAPEVGDGHPRRRPPLDGVVLPRLSGHP
jgi:hypothetical protein